MPPVGASAPPPAETDLVSATPRARLHFPRALASGRNLLIKLSRSTRRAFLRRGCAEAPGCLHQQLLGTLVLQTYLEPSECPPHLKEAVRLWDK